MRVRVRLSFLFLLRVFYNTASLECFVFVPKVTAVGTFRYHDIDFPEPTALTEVPVVSV